MVSLSFYSNFIISEVLPRRLDKTLSLMASLYSFLYGESNFSKFSKVSLGILRIISESSFMMAQIHLKYPETIFLQACSTSAGVCLYPARYSILRVSVGGCLKVIMPYSLSTQY